MSEARIACCYLTYQHPKMIEDLLSVISSYYLQNGMDLYFYDSSPNDETKKVIERFQEQYGEGIYYVSIEDTIRADEKMLLVLQGYGRKREYDYIWPLKERVLFGKNTIAKISERAEETNNGIFLEVAEYDWIPRRIKESYDDPVTFFGDLGWLATSWETMIFHKSLLQAIDWKDMTETYQVGPENHFNYFLTQFVGLAKMETPIISVIPKETVEKYELEGGKCGWINQIYEIWGEEWPRCCNRLPKIYAPFCQGVIKDQGKIPALFGGAYNQILLQKKGILTKEKWEKLRCSWDTLSEIPVEEMDAIVSNDTQTMLGRLHGRIDSYIQKQEMEKLAYCLYQYEDVIATSIDNTFRKILEIWELEQEKNREQGILTGVNTFEEMIQKYENMVALVKSLEKKCTLTEKKEILAKLSFYHITVESLSYIIDQECQDPEAVMQAIEEIS